MASQAPGSTTVMRPTDYFGVPLAKLLSARISTVYSNFNAKRFFTSVQSSCEDLSLTQRVELIADQLKINLPGNFARAIMILHKIMGPENPKETGMFTNYYWLLPVGKFVEKYGLDHYDESIKAIEEITKRNTGEYAIRPFIRKYPGQAIRQMKIWARSDNFHLRRLVRDLGPNCLGLPNFICSLRSQSRCSTFFPYLRKTRSGLSGNQWPIILPII